MFAGKLSCKVSAFLFIFFSLLTLPNDANAIDIPVFPGASGFGTTTVAGSGRHLTPPSTTVYHVTTLANSGEGSLRSCVESTVPRTCIFDISGRIELTRKLVISSPYITIAGQSAPAPGILISGAGIQVSSHDVLIQHLQVRVGDSLSGPDPESRDGVTIAATRGPVYNVVIDRLSISWAIDENVSTWYPNVNDITISNSIISEALFRSIHPKGPHGMGLLIGDNTKKISIHDNLLAHNNDRNPRIKPGTEVEFVSNLVYNWGGRSGWYLANLSDTERTQNPVFLNFIGNYYLPGLNSPLKKVLYASPVARTTMVYVKDNIGPTRKSYSVDEWKISDLNKRNRSRTPVFALSNITPRPGFTTYGFVITNAGARVAESNIIDERIKQEVISGTGSIKDCVSGCTNSAGGYPEMPSVVREIVLPENPYLDSNGDGYTNLENLLHSFSSIVQDTTNKNYSIVARRAPVVTRARRR